MNGKIERSYRIDDEEFFRVRLGGVATWVIAFDYTKPDLRARGSAARGSLSSWREVCLEKRVVQEMATRLHPNGSLRVISARAWDRIVAVNKTNPQEDDDVAAQIVGMRVRLVRFAWSLTRDSEAAEDLAQETIARALGSQWRFQPGTNLKAWLFRILRNIHLNALRSAGTHPALISIEELVAEPASHDEGPNPVEARVIERADVRRVAEIYRTLPPAFAIPLYLTAVEGLSYAQAASILDVPIGTLMSRVYRARRLLVSRLAGGR